MVGIVFIGRLMVESQCATIASHVQD